MGKLTVLTSLLVLAGLLALGSSVSAAAPTGSAPSFAPPKSYATGRWPQEVAIADLNGDGKRDLATANGGRNTVSLLLNKGDGSLGVKRDYRVGSRPGSVAIADLNGDGKQDLATANLGVSAAANTVSVLLNRGDGSFKAKHDYATGKGPVDVAIGDLSGDGTADLATANYDSNTVSVLLNRGDGSFRAKVDYEAGPRPDSVAIGDLNGDGKPDLATANGFTNTVSVLLNRGDGSFKAKHDYRTGRRPRSVAIGDLNGDGKRDLVTANRSGTISVLLNRGDGSFQAKRDYRAGVRPPYARCGCGLLPASVAIGDLNGDGKRDLAIANNGPSTVSVLLNKPGLCTVQNVLYETLPAAKREIARANCRVGKIRRVYSRWLERGRVISQKPKLGAVLPGGGKVNLVVSRGRKPS